MYLCTKQVRHTQLINNTAGLISHSTIHVEYTKGVQLNEMMMGTRMSARNIEHLLCIHTSKVYHNTKRDATGLWPE